MCFQLVVYSDLVIPADTKLGLLLCWCRESVDWYHKCPIFVELGRSLYPFLIPASQAFFKSSRIPMEPSRVCNIWVPCLLGT